MSRYMWGGLFVFLCLSQCTYAEYAPFKTKGAFLFVWDSVYGGAVMPARLTVTFEHETDHYQVMSAAPVHFKNMKALSEDAEAWACLTTTKGKQWLWPTVKSAEKFDLSYSGVSARAKRKMSYRQWVTNARRGLLAEARAVILVQRLGQVPDMWHSKFVLKANNVYVGEDCDLKSLAEDDNVTVFAVTSEGLVECRVKRSTVKILLED